MLLLLLGALVVLAAALQILVVGLLLITSLLAFAQGWVLHLHMVRLIVRVLRLPLI